MAYTDIRDYIAAVIEGADPNVGTVHSRMRWSRDWPTLLSLFQHEMNDGSGKVLRGWMMERTSIVPDLDNSSFGKVCEVHTFLIRGIHHFNDADNTDEMFQSLIDAVRHALNTDEDLGGAATDPTLIANGAGYAVIRTIELRMFGSVLCHYCEIEFPATVMESLS